MNTLSLSIIVAALCLSGAIVGIHLRQNRIEKKLHMMIQFMEPFAGSTIEHIRQIREQVGLESWGKSENETSKKINVL